MKIDRLLNPRRAKVYVKDKKADAVVELLRKASVTIDLAAGPTGLPSSALAYLNPVPPPYNPEIMRKAVLGNNVLLQCVATIVTNCANAGYSINFINKDEELKESPEAIAEFNRIEGLAKSPNGLMSLTALKEKYWWDKLTYGYTFLEVGRDADGNVSWYKPVETAKMRICGEHPEFVQTNRAVFRNGELTDLITYEKFRRYVKVSGTDSVYYKQFGDPRLVDPKTGATKNADRRKNNNKLNELTLKNSATEIIHFPNIPLSLYGNADWENNLPAVLGSREAEIVNLEFFRQGGTPALVVMVSGGILSADAADDIEAKFNDGAAKDKMHRCLVLEAKGDSDLATGIDGSIPAPKIDIKELNTSGKDALFQEYDENAAKKVRSSFRLPAIYIGGSESYNYATARASMEVAENQVFSPKRASLDDILNSHVFSAFGKPNIYYEFRSNGTKITDPEGVIEALSALAESGALDANKATRIYNNLFSDNLPEREEAWADIPMTIVLALLNADNAEELIGADANAAIEELKKKFNKTEEPSITKPRLLPTPPRTRTRLGAR